MGFSEFLGSIVKAFTPPGMSDSPNCARCANCKARIKDLPSGKQIRIFCCPYTGEYDNLSSILPSVNPSDPATYSEYSKKYQENINYVYESMSNCVEQPGGTAPLKNNDWLPITRYNELKYATKNLYSCGHFKPCLFIDNDGSYYIKDNEMLYNSNFQEEFFDNLSEEDQKSLIDLS